MRACASAWGWKPLAGLGTLGSGRNRGFLQNLEGSDILGFLAFCAELALAVQPFSGIVLFACSLPVEAAGPAGIRLAGLYPLLRWRHRHRPLLQHLLLIWVLIQHSRYPFRWVFAVNLGF